MYKWRSVCFLLLPKREPWDPTLPTEGENKLSMLLLYTWWREKKNHQQQKSHCALPKTSSKTYVHIGFWSLVLHSAASPPHMIFILTHHHRSLHICTTQLSTHWWERKYFGIQILFLIQSLLFPVLQYHEASSAKSSLRVLLARSTESTICHLKIYVRLQQP